MIYTDKKGAINKLINDSRYEAIIEIFNDERRLVAGLFKLKK